MGELKKRSELSGLDEWIDGTARPTFRQLELFAKAVDVPLGFLFLESPPKTSRLPLPDFRKKHNRNIYEVPTPELLDVLHDSVAMRDWLREYLEEEGFLPKKFVGSITPGKYSPREASAIIERDAGLADHPVWKNRQFRSWRNAFQFLYNRFVRLGIIVIVRGIVRNNTRRPLNPEEFRGFAIADRWAPLVFVNSNDFQAAQIFTLVHEMVHIWTGQSGISNWLEPEEKEGSPHMETEWYCNETAAEILMPHRDLLARWTRSAKKASRTCQQVKNLAEHFKVSPLAVAVRARTLDLLSRSEYLDLLEQLKKEYRARRKKKADGGNFYAVQRYRLGGDYFLGTLRRAVGEGKLSYREAYRLTHLYGKTFDKCLEQLDR